MCCCVGYIYLEFLKTCLNKIVHVKNLFFSSISIQSNREERRRRRKKKKLSRILKSIENKNAILYL